MVHTEKVTRTQAAKIIAATFPNYKGRKIRIQHVDEITFSDTTWDGGSKNFYAAMSFDGRSENLDMSRVAPWKNPIEGKSFKLPPGYMIVEHTIFMGKDCGLTIYINPASAGTLPIGN